MGLNLVGSLERYTDCMDYGWFSGHVEPLAQLTGCFGCYVTFSSTL